MAFIRLFLLLFFKKKKVFIFKCVCVCICERERGISFLNSGEKMSSIETKMSPFYSNIVKMTMHFQLGSSRSVRIYGGFHHFDEMKWISIGAV